MFPVYTCINYSNNVYAGVWTSGDTTARIQLSNTTPITTGFCFNTTYDV